jgi:protein TonB
VALPVRRELQFVLPQQPTNLKTMFGGAGVIYVAAALFVAFLLWLRPPVPYLSAAIPDPVDITDIVFQNVAGPIGGGGGGGTRSPEPPKTDNKPAIKPPEKQPEPIPVEHPVPPPEPTPPAAQVPAVATDNQLALLTPGPPVPGATSNGSGSGGGVGTGVGTGAGPGNGAGLGPGNTEGVGGGDPGGGAVDVQVVALYTPKPAYTPQAMLRRIQGEVTLSCVVLASGDVGNCRITKSLDSNNFGLDDEALKAAKRFKFKPAMRKGQAVPVTVNIVLDFNMR